MKFTPRERVIFYICLSLLVIIILERVIFRPLMNNLMSMSQEIQLKETRLIKGLRQENQRDIIHKEYKSYETYLKLKGSDEEIISEFLREIEKLGREAGVSLSDIKPGPTNKLSMHKQYLIEVRTEARMKDIISFLYKLNNSLLLLRVDKLSLTLKEEESDILKVNMLISGILVL